MVYQYFPSWLLCKQHSPPPCSRLITNQLGPLFLSPLSEIYGRRILLNLANIFFCAFTLGCALAPNLGGLITMRLLAGLGGSACLTLGAGVISDLFLREQRGRAMSMYSLGVMFGPVFGPICGIVHRRVYDHRRNRYFQR
jgi:MFS family permease